MAKITDHLTPTLEKATSFFASKPRFVSLITAFVNEVQEFEDTAYDVITLSYLSVAEGANLDNCGLLVGLKRDGMTDAEYRKMIRVVSLSNYSKGEAWRLISIVAQASGSTDVKYTPLYPAGFFLRYVTAALSATLRTAMKTMVTNALPSGVEMSELTEMPVKPFCVFAAGDYATPSITGGAGLSEAGNYSGSGGQLGMTI